LVEYLVPRDGMLNYFGIQPRHFCGEVEERSGEWRGEWRGGGGGGDGDRRARMIGSSGHSDFLSSLPGRPENAAYDREMTGR
jgi:hypothetical protein